MPCHVHLCIHTPIYHSFLSGISQILSNGTSGFADLCTFVTFNLLLGRGEANKSNPDNQRHAVPLQTGQLTAAAMSPGCQQSCHHSPAAPITDGVTRQPLSPSHCLQPCIAWHPRHPGDMDCSAHDSGFGTATCSSSLAWQKDAIHTQCLESSTRG